MSYLKQILAFLCVFAFSFGFAQSFYYSGIMGDGLAIQMQLQIEGEQLSGHYYYERVGVPLRLEGSLSGNIVRLEEYVDEEGSSQLTGTFSGVLSDSPTDYSNLFSGEWLNNYGNLFSFSMHKVAEYVDIEIKQNRIETRSQYPYFLDPDMNAVNKLLQDDFIQRQTDFLHEGQDILSANELYNGWILDGSTTLSYYSTDLISLQDSVYFYTGGAHGNVALDSHNLALNDAGIRLLELRDMFAARSDFMSILLPYILNDLRHQEAQWLLDGSLSTLSETDLQNFTISPQGLHFQFEPYLLGPYVQGGFYVLVPFSVMASVIDESSPLYRFIRE